MHSFKDHKFPKSDWGGGHLICILTFTTQSYSLILNWFQLEKVDILTGKQVSSIYNINPRKVRNNNPCNTLPHSNSEYYELPNVRVPLA